MRRSAFTLLEVLLALSIAVLLLGGLYVAMELQLRHADAGREVVEGSTLARGLVERIGVEVSLSLGPVKPQTTTSQPASSTTPSGTGAGTGTAGSTPATPPASTTPTTSGTTPSGGGTSAATTSTTSGVNDQIVFNQGLQGDSGQLTLYVSRWPREAVLAPSDPNYNNPPLVSDLRRITWFLSDSGLARQELLVATSDDVLNAPAPQLGDGNTRLVAREVKAMSIEYYDPTQGWTDSWDGTQPGDDGVTPMGPPAAVKITLTIAMPNPDGHGELPSKEYVHVIPLHAANGMSATASGANTLNPNSSTSTGGTQP